MCRVECVRFDLTAFSSGGDDDVTVFVFSVGTFHVPIVRCTSPEGEWCPVDTRNLPVSFAMFYEVFQLLFAKVVPVRIEYHVYFSIFIVEVLWLKCGFEIIGYIDGTFIVHFLSHTAPALPCKDGTFLPGQRRSDKSRCFTDCFKTFAPIVEVTYKDFRRFDAFPFQTSVMIDGGTFFRTNVVCVGIYQSTEHFKAS